MRSFFFLFCLVFGFAARADLSLALQNSAEGRLEIVKKELKKNPKLIHQVDAQGDNLLLSAVGGEQEATVKELLKHQPNLNHRNKNNFNALDLSLMMGNEKISLLLLKAGAEFQGVDLRAAAEKNMSQSVEWMLTKKISVLNDVDATEGNTALHVAAREGSEQVVKILLRKGAAAAIKNKKGQTPKDLAHQNKHSQTETLLK